jgi:sporulation protein YpjB
MKARVLVIFIFILILLVPITIHAKEKSPIDKLNSISDEALQMVRSSRYDDANKLLLYFSEEFISMDQRPFTMDELRIVTVAHNEALEATSSETMEHSEIVNKVTKFRLVLDAINTGHQPLWTEMEGQVLTVFGGVKEAVKSGQTERFHEQLNSFLSLYQVIYPSLKLDIRSEKVQRLDTKINYIDQYRPKILSEESSMKDLDSIESDLKSIFEGMTEDETDPSLWWVIFTTGSIIVATLSYVGLRKYNGEKNQKREQNRSRELKD